MTVRYRFTVRPPSQFHCPDGWVPGSIQCLRPEDPSYSEQWNYGTVEYPEALTFKVADHWSLDPDNGPRITRLSADGVEYPPGAVMGNAKEVVYDLAVGNLTPDRLRTDLEAKGVDACMTIEVEFDLNTDGRSLTLWR